MVIEPNTRIKQLIAGTAVSVDPHIPLRRYFRSGQELIRMAVIYHEEGSLENAYTLYMKYMVLFLEEISKHPEYPTYSSEQKTKNKKKCMSLLSLAEKIKERLLKRYEKEYEDFVDEQKEIEAQLRRRRDYEEKERKLLKEKEYSERKQREIKEAQDYELAALGRYENFSKDGLQSPSAPPSYDSICSKESIDPLYPRGQSVEGVELPPVPLYPEDDNNLPHSSATMFPQIPSRSLKPYYDKNLPAVSSGTILPPLVDRSVKPLPTSLLGGGGGILRNVKIPSSLVAKFLALADKNTSNNTETCGVLAGSMKAGELSITHLLIPQQSGTSDSCTTHQEEKLFEVQDKYEIITLGWIHTHPSQTAFLSSVDLHTHCSYQLMMPEAIAIVCAPKHKQNAVFTLTPDYGLDYIANCRETGFHPHPNFPELFKEADHAVIEESGSVTVIDLR